jgi:hypothetical protein
VPRNAAVSVGYLWGRPGKRICGIFVGPAARGQLPPCACRESIDSRTAALCDGRSSAVIGGDSGSWWERTAAQMRVPGRDG